MPVVNITKLTLRISLLTAITAGAIQPTMAETLRDVFGGHLAEGLDPAPNPPYGNVVLWSQVDDTLYLSFGSLNANKPDYEAYRDLTIMRVPAANHIDDILDNNKITTPDQRLNLKIQGADIDTEEVIVFGAKRSIIGLNSLRLRDVNLELDSSIRTNFSGTNQTLELANASLQLGGSEFGFKLDATPALITTRAGENELINFSGAVFGGDLNLRVIPGTVLTIRDTGENSATSSSGEALRLRSGVHNILVDNSTLAFEDSQAFFTNGQTTVQNGGLLDISGPQYTVQLGRIAINDSSLTVQRESELQSSLLELTDSTMTVGQGGVANAERIVVSGTANQMIGEGSSRHGHINAPIGDLTLSSGSALTVENGIQFDLSVLDFADNTRISLDDSRMDVDVILSSSSASPNQFTLTNGSVVNVGQLISSSEAGAPTGAPLLQFDLSGASRLKLQPGAEVNLNFNTKFNLSDLDSELNIEGGRMLGSGRITGLGTTLFSFGGIVDPTSLGSAYGQIAFDGTLALPVFSTYKVDIGVDPLTGAALNDVLSYGEQVAIGRPDIVIFAKGNPTADELDGQSFTIIQADSPGVTGAGDLFVLDDKLMEDGSVPALIDFSVVDLNTHGHKDVTLIAEKDIDHLLKHPVIKPSHTLSTTATTVIDPATGIATTRIETIVPDQAVSSGTVSTASTATDPSTGNTAQTNITIAPNPAGGGNHQQTVQTTVTTSTGTVVGQSTQTTQLTSPPKSGEAHKVVTTHITSATGNLVSTDTTTSIQSATTGTANLSSAAQLLVNSANAGNIHNQNALNNLSNAQVGSFVDSIHAEPYSSYMTVSLEHSDMIMNTVLSHANSVGDIRTGRSKEIADQQTRERFWMDLNYTEGDVDGSGDLGDFNYKLSSLTLGQDLISSGDQTIGIFFSYGTQKMDEHDSVVQSFSSDVYHLGAYLNQTNIKGWDLSGVLGYGYANNEATRQILLANSASNTSADYDGHSLYAGVKATAAAFKNDWVTLQPEVGVSYIYYTQDSFKESGDPNLSLALDSANAEAMILSTGVNARFTSLSDSMSIYPLAAVRYEHDFYARRNNEHDIDAALVAHPDHKQTFVGQSRGENALITSFGLGSNINSALRINGGAVYSKHSHGDEWGAGFTLEYTW